MKKEELRYIECPRCESKRGHFSKVFGWWCQDCQKWFKIKKERGDKK